MKTINSINVNVIRDVFDYLHRFNGHTFVLKIEDSLVSHSCFSLLIKDIIRLHENGIKIIIVPGIRDTIERNRKQAGLKTKFINGMRITPVALMPHVKLAAMEVADNLISHLTAGGASGVMGNWIKARAFGVKDGVDFEWTGQVEKIRVDNITKLLEQSFIPVIHPLGFNATGGVYNLSATQVACHICMDISVSKLFFIGQNEGITSAGLLFANGIQIRNNGCFSNLDIEQTLSILKQNKSTISWQQQDYLENAVNVTLNEKVRRVHIISGIFEGNLLREVFSSDGSGTMIYRNRYAHIRQATNDDIPEIMQLLDRYVQKEILICRTDAQVQDNIQDYYIYEVDKAIYGCGALFRLNITDGEIGAIAVDENYKSRGIGKEIMEHIILQAKKKKYHKLFLMTTKTSDWFYEFGFIHVSPEDLPSHRESSYNKYRNARVLMLEIYN